MKRSFYKYMMTLRGYHLNTETKFANNLAKDSMFPKYSEDYHEIANYLEMNTNYLSTMDIFDQLWEQYLENNE